MNKDDAGFVLMMSLMPWAVINLLAFTIGLMEAYERPNGMCSRPTRRIEVVFPGALAACWLIQPIGGKP